MAELEQDLRALGAAIAYPPTPDLAAAVRPGLEARPPRRPAWWPTRRALAIALAVLAVAVGAVMAVPQARTAVLEWLGIRGVKIERVSDLPEIPAAGPLELGERTSLADASRRTGRRVLLPTLDGFKKPDEVYVDEYRPGRPVSLVYGSSRKVRLLVTQFDAELLIEKMLGPETRLEPVSVNGRRGFWIEGALHGFVLRDQYGEAIEETLRLARNTLLWERGGLTLRLEGDLSKKDALRIARSFR